MLDLQPLIDRLVDDLLDLIRTASVEELRDVLAGRDGVDRRRQRSRSGPVDVVDVEEARSGRIDQPPKRSRRSKVRRATRTAPSSHTTVPAVEPVVGEEITDPASLLARGEEEHAAPVPEAIPAPSVNSQPLVANGAPEHSASPAAGAGVVLRRGETLVRASERGVVIRRRKA